MPIIGNWIEVKNQKEGFVNNDSQGYTFYDNKTYIDKNGFYSYNKKTKKLKYLGNSAGYKISQDTLSLFSPDSNKWLTFKILKLTADSLNIARNKDTTSFKHYKVEDNNLNFDKIVLSTSACFGTCAVLDIAINADKSVLFNGEFYTTTSGLHSGKMPDSLYKQIINGFRQVNFDTIEARYHAHWTDDQTVYITIVKDGRIYKSISDYGRVGPFLFEWAYTPLQYVYQSIKLQKLSQTDSIPPISTLINNADRKGMIIKLGPAEAFLLTDYLHEGKKVNSGDFTPRYKLVGFDPQNIIETDGRFYTFAINGKQQTIDIGFNFIDTNGNNWIWSKPNDNSPR